jgi:hypothetical protein
VFTNPSGGADLGYTGPVDCRLSVVACLALWSWMALVPPPAPPPAVWAHWGSIQDVVRRSGGGGVLGRAVLSSLLLVETGARTPSCMLRQPPPTGAEVVAAAGEATSYRGGCLRVRASEPSAAESPTLRL